MNYPVSALGILVADMCWVITLWTVRLQVLDSVDPLVDVLGNLGRGWIHTQLERIGEAARSRIWLGRQSRSLGEEF
jgi:hypothetical protein